MFVFDSRGGYPLLDPMILWSKFFVDSRAKFYAPAGNLKLEKSYADSIYSISIRDFDDCRSSIESNPWKRAHVLRTKLLSGAAVPCVVATPESFFSFPLNKDREFFNFITDAIQPGCILLVGSQFQDKHGVLYQAVYELKSDTKFGGDYYVYKKKHTVPCFEKMPRYLRRSGFFSNIFQGDIEFEANVGDVETCRILHGVPVILRTCSDFFLVTSVYDLVKLRHRYGRNVLIVLHVNDVRFPLFVKKLLKQLAFMRAACARVSLMYIDYCG